MPLYEIPLLQRHTKVGVSTSPGTFGKKVTCLHIDKVGLFVYYDDEKQLDPDFIRRHITLRGRTNCFIEADSAETAIDIFYREWEGAKIGGDEVPEAKALWIDRSKEILELPHCELMRKNKEDQFICGELLENGNGEFGMCVLEGYDAPDDCPVSEFQGKLYDKLHDKSKTNDLPIETVKNFKLIRASRI